MRCYYSAVGKFDCSRGVTALFRFLNSCSCGASGGKGYTCLSEKEFNLIDFFLIARTVGSLVKSLIVAANYFLLRSLAAHLVIADAEPHHVHAHIGRRLVGIISVNLLKEHIEHRENFNVAVIVYGHFAVSIEVERVDHVHIVQVGSSSLVCYVHRVL